MKLIFDLDGTLICPKERMYKLFSDLTRNESIDFENYWNIRYSGLNNIDILQNQLKYSNKELDTFYHAWMEKIESDYYLAMDIALPGVVDFLKDCGKNNDLYICTNRQSIEQLIKQLERLCIIDFFHRIFITENKVSKADLLLKSDILFTDKDWIIGDTGNDITTGKTIGVKTCSVLSGIMSKTNLMVYMPDLIIENVVHFDFYK